MKGKQDEKNSSFWSNFRIPSWISKWLPLFYLIFTVICTSINELLKMIDRNILFSGNSNVLTVIFGATAGILTLIGLIAIYISVNIQHNIQKCKEIEWELEGYSRNISSIKTLNNASREIKNKLRLYHKIFSRCGDHFNQKVINLTQVAIISVAFIWSISVNLFLLPNQTVTEYLIVFIVILICVTIMGKFSQLIGNLKNVEEFGGLKSLIDLINYKGSIQVRKILLLSSIKPSDNTIKFIFPMIVDFGIKTESIDIFNKKYNKEPYPCEINSKIIYVFKEHVEKQENGYKIKESWKNEGGNLYYGLYPRKSVNNQIGIKAFTDGFISNLLGKLDGANIDHKFSPSFILSNEIGFNKDTQQLSLTKDVHQININYTFRLFAEDVSEELPSKNKDEKLSITLKIDLSYSESENSFIINDSQIITLNNKDIMKLFSERDK